MKTIQGKRVDCLRDKDGWISLNPGEYCKDENSVWWVRCPADGDYCAHPITHPSKKERWTVVEHEDGTITASPSIHLVGIWHGYLERGVWREC